MSRAAGPFEVTITPETQDEGEGSTLGRMALSKVWTGDLEGVSHGTMLTAGTPVGSAVYVAVERFTGTLHGKAGSFALRHHAVHSAAGSELTVIVVPDSGSGDLVGLSGALTIERADGKHSYVLDYDLP